MEHVEYMYNGLIISGEIREIPVPDNCEEPMQYTMRKFNFTLQSY